MYRHSIDKNNLQKDLMVLPSQVTHLCSICKDNNSLHKAPNILLCSGHAFLYRMVEQTICFLTKQKHSAKSDQLFLR